MSFNSNFCGPCAFIVHFTANWGTFVIETAVFYFLNNTAAEQEKEKKKQTRGISVCLKTELRGGISLVFKVTAKGKHNFEQN